MIWEVVLMVLAAMAAMVGVAVIANTAGVARRRRQSVVHGQERQSVVHGQEPPTSPFVAVIRYQVFLVSPGDPVKLGANDYVVAVRARAYDGAVGRRPAGLVEVVVARWAREEPARSWPPNTSWPRPRAGQP